MATQQKSAEDLIILSPAVSAALTEILRAGKRDGSYAPPYPAIEQGDALVSELRGASPSLGPEELEARAAFIWRVFSDGPMPTEAERPAIAVSREFLRLVAGHLDTEAHRFIGKYATANNQNAVHHAANALDAMVEAAAHGRPTELIDALAVDQLKEYGPGAQHVAEDFISYYRQRPTALPAPGQNAGLDYHLQHARDDMARQRALHSSPHNRGWKGRTPGAVGTADIPSVIPRHAPDGPRSVKTA